MRSICRGEVTSDLDAAELKERFRGLYPGEPVVYRAPGRVNLIGEHTDYNDGFVMPAAIGLYTWAAIAPRDDRRVVVRSGNLSEEVEFDMDEDDPRPRKHWSDYARGVAVVLNQAGHRLRGANLLIVGEVPIGAGLSSSAAIEVATGYALLENSGMSVDRAELAKLCQLAENRFVGVRSGIMDQFISCFGQAGRALMLDCRSLDHRLLPLPEGVRMAVCNTKVRHELAAGEYNARRADCEAGVRHLAKSLPHVRALRDVGLEELERYGGDLPERIYKRCRHVISENARVLEAAAALASGDLPAFGWLMDESHRSLRDDYEVSCDELDLMVKLSAGLEGVYGARMTGGGFGGCTISLVEVGRVAQFKEAVARGYEQTTGISPDIYVCTAAGGAERLGD